jgi:hypothetical protein
MLPSPFHSLFLGPLWGVVLLPHLWAKYISSRLMSGTNREKDTEHFQSNQHTCLVNM